MIRRPYHSNFPLLFVAFLRTAVKLSLLSRIISSICCVSAPVCSGVEQGLGDGRRGQQRSMPRSHRSSWGLTRSAAAAHAPDDALTPYVRPFLIPTPPSPSVYFLIYLCTWGREAHAHLIEMEDFSVPMSEGGFFLVLPRELVARNRRGERKHTHASGARHTALMCNWLCEYSYT